MPLLLALMYGALSVCCAKQCYDCAREFLDDPDGSKKFVKDCARAANAEQRQRNMIREELARAAKEKAAPAAKEK